VVQGFGHTSDNTAAEKLHRGYSSTMGRPRR